MSILVIITLARGGLLDAAIAPCIGKETGEQALLRQMFGSLNKNDILVGDANFENYFILAALISANIDGVFEKNGSRSLDFRCIKTMMKMEILRCNPPELLRKEIYVHLLVCNLIRALMAKAAEVEGHKPREVSFKTAQGTLSAQLPSLVAYGNHQYFSDFSNNDSVDWQTQGR